ncbi:MAG TPA: hypothetical protein VE087_12735 [Xanthobacteraceae bacterium]|nr:hypothetical protein [Xanthobacteraceae bacterium]
MSRYAYGYSVAPARPTGWRSAFGNFLGVTAVVSLSVISGAVVSYELIGGDARFGSTAFSSAPVAPVQARVEIPVQAPVKLPAKAATTGSVASATRPVATLAASDTPKPGARAEAPAVVAAAPVAAPQAAPSAPVARNDEAAISTGDLTFAKGYALRRAARQAAAQAASPKAAAAQTATANVKVAAADEPGVASEKQFGRPAVVAKRKPTAMAQYPRGERYGMFERFEGPRHQALAFGDSAPQRPVRRSGGWFDGLF